jgi:hypothetical protein
MEPAVGATRRPMAQSGNERAVALDYAELYPGSVFRRPHQSTNVIASEAKQSSFLETPQQKESWIASSLRSSQ